MKKNKSKKVKKQKEKNKHIVSFKRKNKVITFVMNKKVIAKIKARRKFATTKLGKSLKNVKPKHIVEGRLNQIILKYKIKNKKYEVSVIVKSKKQLKNKISFLKRKYFGYETRKNKLKILGVERYLIKQKKKK